jgi:hypothetical protein
MQVQLVVVVLISQLSSLYVSQRKFRRHDNYNYSIFQNMAPCNTVTRSNVLCVLFGWCCSCKNVLVRPTIYRSALYVKYVHMCCRDVCQGSCQSALPAWTQGCK